MRPLPRSRYGGFGQAHQFHMRRTLQELLDEGGIESRLFWPQQQREMNRPVTNDRRINLMHVLEIHEHMVHRQAEELG